MPRRPNILFLMSDEHRADVAGFAGDPVVRTPVLDRLASEGVVFTSAYTPSPICVPMRQCMAAGQLPRTCGVERYGQDLPPNSLTFARWFTQYAYETCCCGKLHHDGPDQMQGWKRRIGSVARLTDAFVEGLRPEELARYRSIGDGKWSDAKEIARAGVGRGPNTHVADELSLQGALAYIQCRFAAPYYDRLDDRPTMLKVSFNRPHYPYFTTEDRFTYYLNRVEPYRDEPVFDHPFLGQRQVRPGVDATEREIRRAVAAYYGMIDEIDTDFGQVLEALEHVGHDLDDWIVIYTSDHGEMLGQHGIWEKQKFFEASARVPLIIRWPRGFAGGRTVDANVNLCDLFATLCELAGLETPPGLDSRSLVPLLHGQTAGWHNESVSQFAGRNLMIKRDALKYQYYGPEMPEVLFDLAADPGETRSFLDEPAYADAVAAFRRRRAELGFGPDADPHYTNAGYGPSPAVKS